MYLTGYFLVSVLLWRTQDRLCLLGHPDRVPDGERRLYEEIITADTELRKIINRMPIFFREQRIQDKTLPVHILQQREVTQLSLSHKVCIPSSAYFERTPDYSMLTMILVPKHPPPFSDILFSKPLVFVHKGLYLE